MRFMLPSRLSLPSPPPSCHDNLCRRPPMPRTEMTVPRVHRRHSGLAVVGKIIHENRDKKHDKTVIDEPTRVNTANTATPSTKVHRHETHGARITVATHTPRQPDATNPAAPLPDR